MSIFDEQISRKPDNYPWAQKFIETAHSGFWTEKEFNFNSDIQDFKVNLTEQEREIIVRSLATIGTVELNLKKFWANLGNNLPKPSLFDLGYTLAHQEVIHGNAYSKLLEILGIDRAFEEILELDIIKGRESYLKKHLHKFHSDNRQQFIYSLILFTLFIENIALFSQFYTIMWFGKEKNLLKDTNKQVEYTSREEELHSKVGIKLINVIRSEHPEFFNKTLTDKVSYEAEQAIKYEFQIVDWIINGYGHETLNSELLKEFIKDRMNKSLKEIGFKKIFSIDKELLKKTKWFEELLLGNNMTDFFVSRPVEYSKSSQCFDESELF